MREKLKNEIHKLIGDDIMNNEECKDMTPTMEKIYWWGLSNITINEMKKIIKENKEGE